MKKMSMWAALYSLTQTTDIAEAIARVDADPEMAKKFGALTSGHPWEQLRPQLETREDAERMMEIAEEWCSFSAKEQAERSEEMQELFCFSTDTKTLAEAIAHLDSSDEWEDFIDMINDPEVFEQDGVPATKEGMLELVEVSFGAEALG